MAKFLVKKQRIYTDFFIVEAKSYIEAREKARDETLCEKVKTEYSHTMTPGFWSVSSYEEGEDID